MTTIRTPDALWFNGKIIPWQDARLHAWSETATRGANVFEGIRAYWHRETQAYFGLSVPQHVRRLYQSAKLLRFPTSVSGGELTEGMAQLLDALAYGEHAYLRPTFYLDDSRGQGVGALDVSTGAYVACFRAPRQAEPTGIRCGVSTWRRPGDLTLSPRVKCGAGFLSLRLARIEAAERGLDDVILLNERGTVAEATTSNVFIVRAGVVTTPPVTVGLLEGLTRERLLDWLPAAFGLPVTEREIGRSELYAADEVFLCSTLHEIRPVVSIDGVPVGTGEPGAVTSLLRDAYQRNCDAGPIAPSGWLQQMSKAA